MIDLEKISNEKPENVSNTVGKGVKITAPRVSIIIPAFNVAAYITECLESVKAQTFKNYEIIVVNDGSPDTEDFESKLEAFRDELIYLKQENRGAGFARNVAIEHARGELLAFLDGDDIWKPEFLESQINFLTENKFDLVYADAELFGGSQYDGQNFMRTSPSNGIADFESLLNLRCNVLTSGTVVRRRTILDAGLFERERVRGHDFVLWLKIAQMGAQIGYQKKILLKYRVRPDSLSGDSIQRVEREIDVFQRLEDNIKLSEAHKKIINDHLERLESDLEIEHGKSLLLQKNFEAAREAFSKANRYRRSNRLRVIIWLLRYAPHVLLKFYQARRSEEIAFVPK